jgi:hypothetical protein
MKNSLLTLGIILMAGVACAKSASAQTFNYHKFTITGAKSTQMIGINDSGNYSGNYTDHMNVSHCALVVGNTVTDINDPNGTGSSCFLLNNSNQVAGSYALSGGFSNGFVYSAGVFTDIIVPTATAGTVAVGINNVGGVVGFFADNVGTHGFYYNGSTYQQLDYPGAAATLAFGINDNGKITLQVVTTQNTVIGATTTDGIHYHQLNVPGAVTTAIHAINNHNQIAFTWTDAGGASHGSLYSQGQFYQIDVPGAAGGTHADGINNHADVVGLWQATPTSNDKGYWAHFHN